VRQNHARYELEREEVDQREVRSNDRDECAINPNLNLNTDGDYKVGVYSVVVDDTGQYMYRNE